MTVLDSVVYLDYAATTPMSAVALAAYVAAAEQVGNASSLHAPGRRARQLVEDARESIAADLGAHPSEVVFTHGGTEANNLAIKGTFWARNLSGWDISVVEPVETSAADAAAGRVRRSVAEGRTAISAVEQGRGATRPSKPPHLRVLVSAIEHHSVLEPAQWLRDYQGALLDLIPVDVYGAIDLPYLNENLTDEIAVISVMLANNEIGTIEPLAQIAELAQRYHIPVHTDAIAAVGQIPVNFSELGVDMLSVAAHKVGGPVSAGALLVKRNTPIQGLIHGGGQERNLRAGTLDVPAIAAFAAALSEAVTNLSGNAHYCHAGLSEGVTSLNGNTHYCHAGLDPASKATTDLPANRIATLRDDLVSRILATIPDATLQGPPIAWWLRQTSAASLVSKPPTPPQELTRLPGNALFTFDGTTADSLLFLLDQAGIAASAGAACTAGVAEPSHVLLACGVPPEQARGALRFTLGAATTQADIKRTAALLPDLVAKARSAR